jgi:outer membrane protein insertion porin family
MGTLHMRNAESGKGAVRSRREFLESIFPVKKGDIFSVAKVRKAIEDYTKLYGNYGFIDFTAVPDTNVHDETKTIDLTLRLRPAEAILTCGASISAGNTGTRDKVIRREMLLNEGDMFRNNLWELSLLRLNQLDYFEARQAGKCRDQAQRQAGHRGHPAEGQGEGQAVHQPDGRRQRYFRKLSSA